jgi:hypothetical protein
MRPQGAQWRRRPDEVLQAQATPSHHGVVQALHVMFIGETYLLQVFVAGGRSVGLAQKLADLALPLCVALIGQLPSYRSVLAAPVGVDLGDRNKRIAGPCPKAC